MSVYIVDMDTLKFISQKNSNIEKPEITVLESSFLQSYVKYLHMEVKNKKIKKYIKLGLHETELLGYPISSIQSRGKMGMKVTPSHT